MRKEARLLKEMSGNDEVKVEERMEDEVSSIQMLRETILGRKKAGKVGDEGSMGGMSM